MSGRAQLMWDEAVTGYDFGPDHPMDPVRLALTRSLVSAFGLDREMDVVSAKPHGGVDPAAGASRGLCGRGQGRFRGPRGCGRRVRARHRGRSGLRRDARGVRTHRGAVGGGGGGRVAGGRAARGELRGRAASRDARRCLGVLYLQRRVDRHRPAAGAGRRAGRVRGCRRASRGRGAGGVLGGSAGSDDLVARASPDPVPADRVAGGDRGLVERGGVGRERGAAAWGPGTRGGCGRSTRWCPS